MLTTVRAVNVVTAGSFPIPSNPRFPGTAVVSAISPDGQTAFFMQIVEGTSWSVALKVDLETEAVLERIVLPKVARRMMVLPSGATLIAIATDNTVVVVELN